MGIEMKPILFYLLSAVVVSSALCVVRLKNILHAVISLGITSLGIAGIFLTLRAEYLAAMQVLIGVGAIIVLIVFALLLTGGAEKREGPSFSRIQVLSFLAALISAVLTAMIILTHIPGSLSSPTKSISTKEIGIEMIRNYSLPLELVSVLLLAALLGAFILSVDRKAPVSGDQSRDAGGEGETA